MRSSLKNLISKILNKKKLLEFFDILEGENGVDILYRIVHDQKNHLINCIISADNMEYMKGSEALKILKNFDNKLIKPIPIALLKIYDNGLFKKTNSNIEWVDEILTKPCSESSLIKFFDDFKVFTK